MLFHRQVVPEDILLRGYPQTSGAVDGYGPTRQFIHARDSVQSRALAAPIGAEQRNDLPSPSGQGQALDGHYCLARLRKRRKEPSHERRVVYLGEAVELDGGVPVRGALVRTDDDSTALCGGAVERRFDQGPQKWVHDNLQDSEYPQDNPSETP
jgi:hypothetical protein